MIDLFADNPFVALQKGLDAASLRQQAIANNVANVNTPGYKTQDVSFEKEFKHAMDNIYEPELKQTNPRHLSGASPLASVGINVQTPATTSTRYDGNNVDIDSEMSKLAENNIRYNAMAHLMGVHFGMLKQAISGGR